MQDRVNADTGAGAETQHRTHRHARPHGMPGTNGGLERSAMIIILGMGATLQPSSRSRESHAIPIPASPILPSIHPAHVCDERGVTGVCVAIRIRIMSAVPTGH